MTKQSPSPIMSTLLTIVVALTALGAHVMQAGIGQNHLAQGELSWSLFIGYWLAPYFLAAIVAFLAGAAVDAKRAARVRTVVMLSIIWTYLAVHVVTIASMLIGPFAPLASRVMVVLAAGLLSQAAWWIVRSWQPKIHVKALALAIPTIALAVIIPLVSSYILRAT